MLKQYFVLAALALTLVQPAWGQTERPMAGCGASLAPLCLPDQIKSRKPFRGPDFSVNEIDLTPAGHLAIYQGIGLSEQGDVTGITKQKSYGTAETGSDVYVGSSANGRYFDVHYRRAGMYGVVQIFGYLRSTQEAQAVGKFIADIRTCANGSTSCAPSQPLVDAGNEVANLK